MLASSTIREARRAGIRTDTLTWVGSLRRYAPEIGDVAILAVAPAANHADILDSFRHLPIVTRTASETASSVTVVTDRGAVTLHVAPPEHAGAALVWHTGSRRHTEQLRERAAARGLRYIDGIFRRLPAPLCPPRPSTTSTGVSSWRSSRLSCALAKTRLAQPNAAKCPTLWPT